MEHQNWREKNAEKKLIFFWKMRKFKNKNPQKFKNDLN